MQDDQKPMMVGRARAARSRGWIASFVSLASLVLVGACGDASPRGEDAPRVPASTASSAEATRAGTPAASAAKVVFLGDSLTSGFGLDETQAFPALVGDALTAEGRPVRVVNAGISGDTTAGGLARLDWLLRQQPRVLVVGLGGNDGLRGLDLAASEANLRAIVDRARAAGTTVVLLGMLLPPNYGPDYRERFAAIYARLAESGDVVHVPFLLEGVGGEPHLNLPDGLHPNAEGHAILARTVLPAVRTALERTPGHGR